jgi:hypothetical protein
VPQSACTISVLSTRKSSTWPPANTCSRPRLAVALRTNLLARNRRLAPVPDQGRGADYLFISYRIRRPFSVRSGSNCRISSQ